MKKFAALSALCLSLTAALPAFAEMDVFENGKRVHSANESHAVPRDNN